MTGGFKGEYKAPAASTSTVRPSFTSEDPSGVEGGLSSRKDFDSEVSSDFQITEGLNAVSGNPRQAIGKKKGYDVSSKGNSFDLGC
jgi:hypothetical protein